MNKLYIFEKDSLLKLQKLEKGRSGSSRKKKTCKFFLLIVDPLLKTKTKVKMTAMFPLKVDCISLRQFFSTCVFAYRYIVISGFKVVICGKYKNLNKITKI